MNPSARQGWCRKNGLIFDEQVEIENHTETILILTSLPKSTILRLIQETREAEQLGLGPHPHILTLYDLCIYMFRKPLTKLEHEHDDCLGQIY